MDTIEVSLKLNGEIMSTENLDLLRKSIDSLRSSYGYRYCNVLEYSRTGNLIVKISYPRFYEGTNAFLINSRKDCFEVQRHFSKYILEDIVWERYIESIIINRVDIPFTYYMRPNEEFSYYDKIFRIFAYVYDIKVNNARTKGYLDLKTDKFETLIYAPNGSSGKSYNNRLEIYNQNLNLSDKIEEKMYEEILHKYDDLPNRMRMEVSKRIRLRRSFSSKEFEELDLLGEYFEQYKNYILEKVLDFNIINQLYDEWAEELSDKLIRERNDNKFKYGEFIYRNQKIIYDYEIIRRAFNLGIDNRKTRENAITTVRKILMEYEKSNNIILMDVYGTLEEIYYQISNTFLID